MFNYSNLRFGTWQKFVFLTIRRLIIETSVFEVTIFNLTADSIESY